MLFFYFVRLLFIEGIDVLEMALYRAACNIIDNTITTVLSRWGGFSPNLAVITHSPPQHNNQVQFQYYGNLAIIYSLLNLNFCLPNMRKTLDVEHIRAGCNDKSKQGKLCPYY